MILFFDVETTGKADMKRHCDDPCQPHLVKLGALLTDKAGKEISSVNLIIKPEGWDIPDEAAEIHGITTQIATHFGVPIVRVLSIFHNLASSAKTFVAHNIKFDEFILRGEFARNRFTTIPFDTDKEFLCTMLGMMDYCKLPGDFNGEYKWPKLEEAYRHAFGAELEDAHSANADVRACADLHFWIEKQMELTK